MYTNCKQDEHGLRRDTTLLPETEEYADRTTAGK